MDTHIRDKFKILPFRMYIDSTNILYRACGHVYIKMSLLTSVCVGSGKVKIRNSIYCTFLVCPSRSGPWFKYFGATWRTMARDSAGRQVKMNEDSFEMNNIDH